MTDAEEMRRLQRGFRVALLGLAAAFLLIGGLVAAYGTGADRPEGVTERWLSDVGDTRRDGVKDLATDKVEEVGSLDLANHLLPKASSNGRSAFLDLEVGKAVDRGGATLVPFRLHQRIGNDAGPALFGTVRLHKVDGDWRIDGVLPRERGIEVPSEGGSAAAKAPFGLYLGAVGIAVLITAAGAYAIRSAGSHEADPATA